MSGDESPLDVLSRELIALGRAKSADLRLQLGFALGRLNPLVARGELDRRQVDRQLISMAVECGLDRTVAHEMVTAYARDDAADPPRLPTIEERGDDGTIARELADEPLNDYGNARRLIARHGRDMVYVDEAGWYVFNGTRFESPLAKWAPEAQKRAQLTALAIVDEARSLESDVCDAEDEIARKQAAGYGDKAIKEAKAATDAAEKRREAHFRFATTSGNSGKIAAMLVEAMPYRRRAAADLDRNGFLLNVANGTLELGRRPKPPDTAVVVKLRRHDRADLITHLSPVLYDPEASAPQWHTFLERVQPEPSMRRFLQATTGYCCSGDTGEQVVLLFHGKGANGKSTYLKRIVDALGDYALTLPIQTFLADDRRGGGDATPDLARLPGARLVVASEPERGARLSESIIKMMTGGERIVARRLFEGQFEFDPVFKLILSANEKPRITGHDEGIWRRVLLVPWPVLIPPGERDRRLAQRLQRELPGILNWIIEGYRIWRREGLVVPELVRAATQEYHEQSDPVGQFLATCVRHEPDATLGASLLHEVYSHWSRSNGVGKPWSQKAFGGSMTDRGYRRIGNWPVLYQDVFWTADGRALLQAVNEARAKRGQKEFGGLDDSAAPDDPGGAYDDRGGEVE